MRTFLVLAAIMAFVAGAAVAPAHAVIVQLSTEASFNGGPFATNPSYTVWPGTGAIEFSGLSEISVDTDAGTFSLGTFNVTGHYGATRKSTPNPLPFTVKITHASGWREGSGTFAGSLSGSFGEDWTNLKLTIPATDVLIDDYIYEVHGLTARLFHEESVNADHTLVTPEPSTLLLLGTGLAGLAGAVRRKISRRKI